MHLVLCRFPILPIANKHIRYRGARRARVFFARELQDTDERCAGPVGIAGLGAQNQVDGTRQLGNY
jgi:hypothetical protein